MNFNISQTRKMYYLLANSHLVFEVLILDPAHTLLAHRCSLSSFLGY